MKREYSIDDFRVLVDYLLNNVPDVTVATDIICGFPNETEGDFDKTLALIEHYKFAIVNISQFYPRPGTPAAKMRRIATQVVKDRSRRLTAMFEAFSPYTGYVGQRGVRVWFNTEISDDKRHSVGHTKSYVKVLVPLDRQLVGRSCLVDVLSCSRFHIEGAVVEGTISGRRVAANPQPEPQSEPQQADDSEGCGSECGSECGSDQDCGCSAEEPPTPAPAAVPAAGFSRFLGTSLGISAALLLLALLTARRAARP